jgi:ABC-type bacteriocin/lantibiotic exporter with double-glycine peptidase domain
MGYEPNRSAKTTDYRDALPVAFTSSAQMLAHVPLAVVRRLLPLLDHTPPPPHWTEGISSSNTSANHPSDAAGLAAEIARLGQRANVALVRRSVPVTDLKTLLDDLFHPIILFRRVAGETSPRPVVTWSPQQGHGSRHAEELTPDGDWVAVAIRAEDVAVCAPDEAGSPTAPGVVMLFPLALPTATTATDGHIAAAPGNGSHSTANGHGDHQPAHRSPMGRLIDLLRMEKRDIWYIYVYTIAVALLNLVLPLGVQALIGLMSGGMVGTSLVVLIALIILSIIISGVLQVQQISLVEVLQRRIFARTALDFARRLPRVEPTQGWEGEYPPEVVNRFFDFINIQKGLPKLLIDISAAVLQVVFGLLVLSFYHSFFIFFSMILIMIIFLIVRTVGPKGLKTSITESKYKYRAAFWLEEIGRALSAFRLAPHGTLAVQKADMLVAGYLHYRKEHFKVLMTLYGYAIGFKVLVVGGLLILASVLLGQGQISLGQIVASELIIVLIVGAVEKLILSLDVVYDLLTGLDKLGHVTDKPLEETAGLNPDFQTSLRVSFEGVSTHYPMTRRVVARHASLVIEPNARLGLTSSDPEATVDLCRTLLGQLPYEGTITVNGFALPSVDREALRRQLGETITQRDIFAGTALENITLGRPSINTAQLQETLNGLGLQDLINQLPRGLDTELIPADPALPDELVAKLLLARAVISRPRLLLLRDPVELEPHDRQRVFAWLFHESRPWAVVCLTDSPAVLRQLRHVAVVREGQVSQPAPYDELLEKDRAFRELMAELVA